MITLNGGRFEAPLNAPYVKELTTAFWRKSYNCYWTEELERVLPVLDYLSPELRAQLLGVQSSFAASSATKPSGKYEVKVKEGRKLYDYQLASVEFILGRKDTLLAEDAGTGKTAIMITAANTIGAKRILVVCPAIAKYNWALKEWPKWAVDESLTVGVVEKDNWVDTDVVIINYDILDRHKSRIQAVEWDVLFVDESHRINNISAKRTVMVLGGNISLAPSAAYKFGFITEAQRDSYGSDRKRKFLIPPISAGKRVFATATPMNLPRDLWTVCHAFDPDGIGKDWKQFHALYCGLRRTEYGWDTKGSTNLKELGARLRSTFMVRHDATEVLDLPPLREDMFLLPPVKIAIDEEEGFVSENIETLLQFAAASGHHEITAKSAPEDFLRMIGEAIIDNVSLIGKPEFVALFSKFSEIRKKTGVAKVPDIIDFIRTTTDDLNRPVVVFGYHREVLLTLAEEFPGCALVIGGLSSKKRDEEVDRFQNGETNIFLGNWDAAGEAVTLTRSSYFVAAELDWRGTAMIQGRKRIHRITQEHPCNVIYLVSAKSFDSIVAKKGFSKMRTISRTLDF